MIVYPALLPPPLVKGHKEHEAMNFKRSRTAYAQVQSRSIRDNTKFTFSIAVNYADAEIFRLFYDNDLYRGVAPFKATWVINGVEVERNIRFTAPFKISSHGSFEYTIQCQCEVLP